MNFLILSNLGEYHQFDSMALPEPKSRFGSKALKNLRGAMGIPESDKTFNYNQEKCLLYYLDDLQKVLLNCELSPTFDIHAVTEKILHIFNQLFLSKVQALKPGHHGKVNPVHIINARRLPEVCMHCVFPSFKCLVYLVPLAGFKELAHLHCKGPSQNSDKIT